MAEYGEWNRKGATLSDVTAEAEYGVSRDFIVKGIQAAKLEYRQGAIWGNPYLRIFVHGILAQEGRLFADQFVGDGGALAEMGVGHDLAAEVDALRGCQQFDGQDGLDVAQHATGLRAAIGPLLT